MDRVGGYHRKEAEQRRTLVASEASQAPLSVGTTRVARAVGEPAVVVRLREEEIPWADIAFSSVKFCLQSYFDNRSTASDPAHLGHFVRSAQKNH